MRRPFFRKQTKCWYVKGPLGEFIRLDEDEERAHKLWLKMLDAARFDDPDASFYAISQAWLTEFEQAASESKYKDAVRVLKDFSEYLGESKRAQDVQSSDIIKWLAKKDWSPSRERDAGRYVKRVVKFAFDRGYIPRNLVADLKLRSSKPRISLVEEETHSLLIQHCKKFGKRTTPLIPVLIALRHSGARPASIRAVQKKDVALGGAIWVLPEHKNEHRTSRPLVVPLSPCLQTLTQILAANRDKHLFLNSRGEPWTKSAIVSRLRRIRAELGIQVIAYSYRHTFATDALLAGQDLPTVAAMMGHSDVSMVSRVYGHLDQNSRHLVASVANVRRKVQ